MWERDGREVCKRCERRERRDERADGDKESRDTHDTMELCRLQLPQARRLCLTKTDIPNPKGTALCRSSLQRPGPVIVEAQKAPPQRSLLLLDAKCSKEPVVLLLSLGPQYLSSDEPLRELGAGLEWG